MLNAEIEILSTRVDKTRPHAHREQPTAATGVAERLQAEAVVLGALRSMVCRSRWSRRLGDCRVRRGRCDGQGFVERASGGAFDEQGYEAAAAAADDQRAGTMRRLAGLLSVGALAATAAGGRRRAV